MNLPKSAICYFVRGEPGNEEIFLGRKVDSPKSIKRKIAGKLMSYGGDIEEKDASIKAGTRRELLEESKFIVEEQDMEVMAEILVIDENGPRLTLYYVVAKVWRGEPGHHEDILNPTWYQARPIPHGVPEADEKILPLILDGIKIRGHVLYDENLHLLDFKLNPVEDID